MTKNLRNCPNCLSKNLVTEFAVVRRETCAVCHYVNQSKITGLITGGAALLDHLVNYFIQDGVDSSALSRVLQRQLAKVGKNKVRQG